MFKSTFKTYMVITNISAICKVPTSQPPRKLPKAISEDRTGAVNIRAIVFCLRSSKIRDTVLLPKSKSLFQ
ncbi:hypothetical protein ERICII_00882 [Paenibacillus larvae subsp. larvae DSM 25430]|nr:hypothetical protein ERICII_00882 [Paenibacillus larvae subsp. larvae DSM 25430]